MQPVKVCYLVLAAWRSVRIAPSSRLLTPWCCCRFAQTGATTEELPVIRVPVRLQKSAAKVKQTRSKNKLITVKAGKLLIQSKNPNLNQSAGYVFRKFEEPVLSSKGWKHKKSFGDYFTIKNTKTVAPFVVKNQERDGDQGTSVMFDKLKICPELVEALKNINIIHPTSVQLQTIPKVLSGHNVLCAAETGSGKTFCYLLPIVQRLHANQSSEMYGDIVDKVQALVLVPSRELAQQVVSVSRSLCAPFSFVTKAVGGGRGVGRIKNVFKSRLPDILVATPGALIKALRRHYLDLSNLSFMVVDEADTMFDPSFSEMLETILCSANIAKDHTETQGLGHRAQLLVVGATFPGGVGEVLNQVTDISRMVVIKSKMLHFLMPHVKQTFLKIKGAEKVLELHQALKLLQQEKGGGAVLVFCNKSTTVDWLSYTLNDMGVRHARLQGAMPAAVRVGIFQSFQKGMVDVLVCTDIASRGVDTSRVHLVVNYDFPESHTDYIHRAGRVGRAGGVEDGEVLSFVTHPWDVELVQKIESAARRGTRLPGMESEIHQPKPKAEELHQESSFQSA
ncbi:probable ATP-dependent RNA helicase DDX28 [Thalassophryne amazonica]|uniref:probable ATP-dependent RNA helicase DDX28 n=1 Tax=Thalassophryne amazonica TaxID=390379 RepID=UPI0014717176|nr:probable ATP-dependent RNA helicase DDX28 [Thalassophryne amazonica]